MNLETKKLELISLLHKYLDKNISYEKLSDFAWDVVDSFSNKKKQSVLKQETFEKEFWFSIWQIIHLADYEHEQDGVTKKELTKALNFLEHIEEIPMNCIGERP